MTDAWIPKEKVRSVYPTDDPDLATERLDDTIAWCTEPEAGPELRTPAAGAPRFAHHHTGASNGRSEAANLLIKQVKRAGRGFRNLANYRLSILLAGGNNPTRRDSHRHETPTRRPRLIT